MAKDKQGKIFPSLTTMRGVLVLRVFSRVLTQEPCFDFGTRFDLLYKEVGREEAFLVLYKVFLQR